MSRIISISNRKGGTGKTTTSVNLACGLSMIKNKKVLLIDLDPQANATVSVGYLPNVYNSLIRLFLHKHNISELIIKTNFDNLYLLPSTTALSKIEARILYEKNSEYILHDEIKKIESYFDFIIIDCPPYIGMFGLNAIIASNEIIIPLRMEFLSMEGTNQFFNIITKIIEKKDLKLKIDGILFTCVYNENLNTINSDFLYFGTISLRKFKTEIRYDINIAEAPKSGKPIFLYAPNSIGAIDYLNFIDEVLNI